MTLVANPEHAKKVIEIILEWHKNPDGVLESSDLPESILPGRMEAGSLQHILFLTMAVSIDYQRPASGLWIAARETWEDEQTRWVFTPGMVAERPFEDLIDGLARHKLSKKREKDARIWHTISRSFAELYSGDPRELFARYDYDAQKVVHAMRTIHGKDFPYLAGATGTGKIRSLWIRMLYKEAGVSFTNISKVPIPIDIHTARATIMTGCLSGEFDGGFSDLAEQAKDAWVAACDGTSHYPLELDESLWNLGRFGCTKYKENVCPVKDECRLADYCTANVPSSVIQITPSKATIETTLPDIP